MYRINKLRINYSSIISKTSCWFYLQSNCGLWSHMRPSLIGSDGENDHITESVKKVSSLSVKTFAS